MQEEAEKIEKEIDHDPLANTATVYATYNSSIVSASDTWVIDILHPSIMVEKTANATETYIGDTIQYKINVTNTGDCELHNVNVSDSQFGNLLTNGILEPKQSIIFTKTYIAESEGQLVNTANASGADPLGMRVYNEDSWTVNVLIPTPATATVTFNTTGLSLDASDKTVLTVDGTSYTFSQLPLTFEWIVGSSHNFSWKSPVEVNSGKHYIWTSTSGLSELQNGEIKVPAGGGNITGNYKTQYLVTFSQNGLDSSASGIIVTVNGEAKEYNNLPFGVWVDSGSTLCYAYEDTVSSTVSGKRFRLYSVSGPNSPITVTEPVTVTGNYITQYHLMVETDPDGLTPQPTREPAGEQDPAGGWWYNASISVTLTAQQVEGFKFRYWSVNGANQGDSVNPITVVIDESKTAIAHYAKLPTVANVTFSIKDVQEDYTGIILIVDEEEYDLDKLPITFTWDIGSNHTFEFKSPLIVNLNQKRYVWISTSGLSVLRNGTITVPNEGGIVEASYKTQYYLNVQSSYGVTDGEGWYDEGATAYARLNTGLIDHGNGTRRAFTHWSGDASGANYAQSNPIIMNASKTAIAVWKTQHYLTVVSPYDTPGGMGWYDEGATAYATLAYGIQEIAVGKRARFTSWSGDASGTSLTSNPITMDKPKTAIALWTIQWYLTVKVDPFGIGTIQGEGWYDDSTSVTLQAPQYLPSINGVDGIRYRFSHWDVDGAQVGGNPITVHMNAAHTATAHYIRQYEVAFGQTGVSSEYMGCIIEIDSVGYGLADLPKSFWWDEGSTHEFTFQSPLNVNAAKRFVWVSTTGLSPHQSANITITELGEIIGNYKTQWLQIFDSSDNVKTDGIRLVITVNDAQVLTNALPYELWADTGTTINYRFEDEVSSSLAGKRYKLKSISGPLSGYVVSSSNLVRGNYGVQYYLDVNSPYGAPTPKSGWHDAGTLITAFVTSPWPTNPINTRYICIGWTGTGSVPVSGTKASVTFVINEPSSITWNWKTQYLVNFTQTGSLIPPVVTYQIDSGPTATKPAPFGLWIDAGSQISYNYPEAISEAAGTRYLLTSISPTSPQIINTPLTVIGTYITQYYLDVVSPYGSPSGMGWYDEGAIAHAALAYGIEEIPLNVRFVFTGWSGDASGTNLISNPILMDAPKTAIANWKTQFYLTLNTSPEGVTAPFGEGWYDADTYANISTPQFVEVADGSRYRFNCWTTSDINEITDPNTPTTSVLMDKAKTVTANYIIQYYLEIEVEPPDSAIIPGEGWYDEGAIVVVVAPEYWPSTEGKRFHFDHWTINGTLNLNNQLVVLMDKPHSATAHYIIQYSVTFIQTGLDQYAVGKVLEVNGSEKAFSDLPFTMWVDHNATIMYSFAATVSSNLPGSRYSLENVTGPASPLTVTQPATITGNYEATYYLEVISEYGDPYGSGWYKRGSTATFGVTTPVDHGNRTIRVFLKWSGDAEIYEPEGTLIMTKPSTVTASWQTMYLVTFNTTLPNNVVLRIPNVPTTLPAGMNIFGTYYPVGEHVTVGPAPKVVMENERTRYTFKKWTLNGTPFTENENLSFIVNQPLDFAVVYDVEHLLEINARGVEDSFKATVTIVTSTPMGYELSPTSPIQQWIRQGTRVTLTISTPNKIGHGEWAIFQKWSKDISETNRTATFTMLNSMAIDAIFFKVNPVAMSIPYSILAGLITMILCVVAARRSKPKDKKSNRRAATAGVIVMALAIIVAAIVSSTIAMGYGINPTELVDFTNWAVVFLVIEAIAFFFISTLAVKKAQRTEKP
ncbi:MAG: hypothetical protein QXR45_12760 [Candidatus Bathyarchaeia archaeon]